MNTGKTKTQHVRHPFEGSDYLRHETRLMDRWCRIYGRSENEFVLRHAGNYSSRHEARDQGCPPCAATGRRAGARS